LYILFCLSCIISLTFCISSVEGVGPSPTADEEPGAWTVVVRVGAEDDVDRDDDAEARVEAVGWVGGKRVDRREVDRMAGYGKRLSGFRD